MRFNLLLSAALVFSIVTSCEEPGNGNTTVSPPAQTPGVATIGSEGGTVALAGVAELEFPTGSLTAATQIQITQVPVTTLPAEYGFNTNQFYAANPLSTAVVVRLSQEEPSGSVGVRLTLPSDYIASKPANEAFAVMAGTINASDFEGPYDTYELVDPIFEQSTRQLLFTLNGSYFTQRDAQNNVLARLVVVQVPGPQRSD